MRVTQSPFRQFFFAAGAVAAAGDCAGFAGPASLATRNFTRPMTSSAEVLYWLLRRYLPFTTSVGVLATCIAMICESAWRAFRSTLNDFDAATKSAAFT